MSKFKYSEKEIIDAIQQTHGIITAAAGFLGCTPRTIYNYIERFPAIQEAIDSSRSQTDHMVISKLIEGIQNNNTAMIIFYLKTRMGWKEGQKIELSGELKTSKDKRDKEDSADYWEGVISELEERGIFKEITDSP